MKNEISLYVMQNTGSRRREKRSHSKIGINEVAKKEERERERERETERETERQRETERDRERDKERQRETRKSYLVTIGSVRRKRYVRQSDLNSYSTRRGG